MGKFYPTGVLSQFSNKSDIMISHSFQDILNDSGDCCDLRVHCAVRHLHGAADSLPLHVRLRPPRLLQVRHYHMSESQTRASVVNYLCHLT